jgi:tetratricopeptide (TPR) repeat protein
MRPIQNERPKSDELAEGTSVRAQYQQLPAATAGPRIVELSPSGEKPSNSPIRPPNSAITAESTPPAPPPLRSEFVPIAMPEQSRPTGSASPPPELPPQPTFGAAPPDGSPPAADGPQLSEPTGPAQSSPPQPPAVTVPPSLATSSLEMNHLPNVVEPPPVAPTFNSSPSTERSSIPPPAQSPVGYRPNQMDAAAMRIMEQRAMQAADRAAAVAQRGMFYTARTELIQALQFVAQSLDAQEGGARRTAALAAGLRALAEARDFSASSSRPGEAIDLAAIAASHRTNVLKESGAADISPIAAQQCYFAEAERQLAIASGGLASSSQILYRLGRLETAMAAHDSDGSALHAPQAIVFHQAALAIDGGNWLAANELGVLFARYGQLAQARQILQHSISIHPHIEGWQNLATIHRQLGETDLAQRAESERKLLAQKSPQDGSGSSDVVKWVDPKTFAASGGADTHWPADERSAQAAPASARR